MTLKDKGNCGKQRRTFRRCLCYFKVKKSIIYFQEEEVKCFYELPISFTEAVLGAEVEISHLEGKEIYTIPEGTETGTIFKLSGRGISDVNGYGKGI